MAGGELRCLLQLRGGDSKVRRIEVLDEQAQELTAPEAELHPVLFAQPLHPRGPFDPCGASRPVRADDPFRGRTEPCERRAIATRRGEEMLERSARKSAMA